MLNKVEMEAMPQNNKTPRFDGPIVSDSDWMAPDSFPVTLSLRRRFEVVHQGDPITSVVLAAKAMT